MNAQRLSLILLSVSACIALCCFVLDTPWNDAVFALAAITFPCALMLLGASRAGRAGPVVWVVVVLWLVLTATFVGMLRLRGVDATTGPSFLGLPLAMALQLYGLFALPWIGMSWAYGWMFDGWTLRSDDLRRLRQRFPERRQPEAP